MQGTPTKEQYYQIFQSPNNFLQISLYPHHNIYVQRNAVAYTSPNISLNYYPKSTPENTILSNALELSNHSETLAYAGISNANGRIIYIDPLIQPGMLIRESYILAYTSGVRFEEPGAFFKMKGFKKAVVDNALLPCEKVLVQAGTGIIEKMLGKDEEFYVCRNRVIGIQKSVKSERKGMADCFVGPGLVLVDTSLHINTTSFMSNLGRYSLLLLVIIRVLFAYII